MRPRQLALQLSLLDWRMDGRRALLAECRALVFSLERASAGLGRLAEHVAAIVAPAPNAARTDATTAELPERMPCDYSVCRRLGLGLATPCPFYGCRDHLGLEVADDGSVRVIIDPDHIDEAAHTCAIEAGEREWTPREIAEQLGFSVGLEELVQRHALLKVLGPVQRVYDPSRRCFIDVDGSPDCR